MLSKYVNKYATSKEDQKLGDSKINKNQPLLEEMQETIESSGEKVRMAASHLM